MAVFITLMSRGCPSFLDTLKVLVSHTRGMKLKLLLYIIPIVACPMYGGSTIMADIPKNQVVAG